MSRSPRNPSAPAGISLPASARSRLLRDIRGLIESARGHTAAAVNSELVMLYWNIGARIRGDILKEKRAGYGERVVHGLSRRLVAEYGCGFAEKNLHRMLQFAEAFPSSEIVAALRRQLSWTHFRMLLPLQDPLQREFYAELCRVERWSTRTLQRKISSLLFERTAISRKPVRLARRELAALRESDRMTPDLLFRDPYVLDFLGLKEAFDEKGLEAAILRELERFILELGAGFSFVARQKRILVDADDYYLDLLFFHRGLRRLVAVELKLGRFRAADKGQMELYLRWLDRHERRAGEETPLGLILCAGKAAEHVALLELERSGIRVAEYLTELPPRRLLEARLHDAIRLARHRLTAGV
jgi:predicted nuclease of restriction endonuclease-like (RecB) superfamily